MCLTIEDGLLSLLTVSLIFTEDPTKMADKLSEHGLIPNEVKDDVHRLYKTGNYSYRHWKCRVLQTVKHSISTIEIEQAPLFIMVLENFWYMYKYIEIKIYFMKHYLCKLLCVRGKGMGLIYNVYSTTSTNSTSISIS